MCGHLPADFFRRIFADVRNNDGDFAGFDFLRRFRNHFEQQRVDVISAGQQDVFLRTALAALADELVSVLEVVVTRNRLGDVVARIERRAVECFDEADLVFVDHGRVEESHIEQSGLNFAEPFQRA